MCRCFFSVSCLQVLEAFRNDTDLSLPETGFYVVNLVIFFSFSPSPQTHNHAYKLYHSHCISYACRYFFVERVVIVWNSLSSTVQFTLSFLF